MVCTVMSGHGGSLKIALLPDEDAFPKELVSNWEMHHTGRRRWGHGPSLRAQSRPTFPTEWRRVLRCSLHNKTSYLCSIAMNPHTLLNKVFLIFVTHFSCFIVSFLMSCFILHDFILFMAKLPSGRLVVRTWQSQRQAPLTAPRLSVQLQSLQFPTFLSTQ